jgi:SPX domain protein involved in polyphosphate accumulation
MTPPLPSLRYEKKFMAEGLTTAEVLARVKRHPAAFREVYPPRVVNNIYLDSPTRRDYHDHVNGTANRTKTRVRWYGPLAPLAPHPVLERKLKRGMVSGKEAHPLPPLALHGARLRSLLESTFDSAALPPLLRSALRLVEPALLNRYHRHYFLSGDRRFRLTIDSDLQFAGLQHNRRPVIAPLHPAATIVLELKFRPEFAEAAEAITNAWPFRVARFSKYVVGIQAV